MKTKEEILQECTVDGLIVRLPEGQLDRKLYQEVAKSLELIGGKWKGGKVMGFVFSQDPTELLEQIANGEKRNLKKEFQFFGTPDKLADELVKLAEIKPTHKVFEPSAGKGSIIRAIQRVSPVNVHWCELMPVNQMFLNKMENTTFVCEDIFKYKLTNHYDRIIANPPFSKNQDIDHVIKMYDLLKNGGRLVSITSTHWENSTNTKETEFRDWLHSNNAKIIDIEAGTFKESGTMVGGKIIVINK